MTENLARLAREVGSRSDATPAELFDAFGELITFGDLDAAESIIARLKAAGQRPHAIRKMEEVVKWFRTLGPQFLESFLHRALAIVEDDAASPMQLLAAAENLIVWGSLDAADRALERLSSNDRLRGPVNRLASASRQLRRSGLQSSLQSLPASASLNKPYEVLISRRNRPVKRTIIVFTGFARRFWLSLNALHQYLRKLDANIIYLNDHSSAMYLNGLASIGEGYGAMVGMLRQRIKELGSPEVFILTTSAGGFTGLRAAIDLEADCFAGMSIRTSLLESSAIPLSPFEKYAVRACRDPQMLVDLRPLLEASNFPRRVQLYCGALSKFDRAHIEHLDGIARVEAEYLKDYGAHDVVGGLIARGQFDGMLQRFAGFSGQQGSAAGWRTKNAV